MFVQLAPSVDRSAVLEEIRKVVRINSSNIAVFELDGIVDQNLTVLGSIWSTLSTLPLFALVSAAACLTAHMILAADEQRQEFAILRITGAKPRVILSVLTLQNAIMLLSSYAIGMYLGIMVTLMILIPQPAVTANTVLSIAIWLLTAALGVFLLSLYSPVKFAKTPLLSLLR